MADLALDHRLPQRPYSCREDFVYSGVVGGFDAFYLQEGPQCLLALHQLLQEVEQGQDVEIARSGVPVARLLPDTQLLLWWLDDDARLPQEVVARLLAPEAEVFVSQASLWEMAIKLSISRLQVDLPELERQVPLQGFRWLPISNAHVLTIGDLKSDGVHRDFFDRLLVYQSRVEPMLLLSGDSQLRRYGATVIVI